MLPAHLAENIRKQVLFYLQSTFDFREKSIEKAFERFLTDGNITFDAAGISRFEVTRVVVPRC